MNRQESWFEEVAREQPRENGNGAGPGAYWRNLLQKSPSTGAPIANLANALLALRNDPAWVGKFTFNEMRRSIIGPKGPMQDHHVIPIHEWLQHNGLIRIGIDTVREAVEGIAHEHSFHPLRDELKALEWDGTLRLSSWLTRYLGVAESDYAKAVGAFFLIQMVARVFKPGCQADYMLVLEGAQGDLKSQACRTLGGKYFSDHLPDLDGDPVRVSMHLRGKWLIEVSELSAFGRAEITRLKSFITRPVENFTAKYGRMETEEPRQCCLVGTTNDPLPLRDETGNRRFWIVQCGTIKLDALREARDQLFAEAVDSFNLGAQWWPDRDFEQKHIQPVQEDFRWVDAWADPLDAWLSRQLTPDFSLAEVAQGALDLPANRFGTPEQRRLASLMREAGWELFRPEGKLRRWRRKAS